MSLRSTLLGVLLGACLITLPLFADSPPAQLRLTTERVVIFKNGYCLIIKRGVATPDARGEVYTDEVPDAAVLGSFWATPERGALASMTAGWQTAKEVVSREVDCTRAIDVLQANVGKPCTIRLTDDTTVRGTIAKVLLEAATQPVGAPQRSALGLGEARPGATTVIATAAGSQFVLATGDGELLLPVAMIRTLQIKGMATTIAREVTTTRRTKRLTLRLAEPGKGEQALRLMYFRPGVRWIPTYRVELGGDDKDDKGRPLASIALQAELLNEAEDLGSAKLDLVVGVPNFRFQSIPSPLSLEGTLRNALAQAAPAIMGNNRSQLSNALYTQRAGDFRRSSARAGADPAAGALPAELTGNAKQDLFVYHLPALSLAKGARMAVPIFSAKVPYRGVYTWELHAQRNGSAGAPSAGASSPLRLSTNEVWHQLALTNTTGMPWTTGSAMLLDGGQPLGQELLTYTSPRDEVRVPVTVAIDVRGSFSDEETAREHNALNWSGNRYAKISRKGKLSLCNHKREAITIEITCQLGGRATAASDGGAITLSDFDQSDWTSYRGHPGANNHSTVRWTRKLEPGEVFEPTVESHYYLYE